jgi:transketolase C-terminal domain/subunit
MEVAGRVCNSVKDVGTQAKRRIAVAKLGATGKAKLLQAKFDLEPKAIPSNIFPDEA